MSKRQHWTSDELLAKFDVSRARLSKIAQIRGVKPIGVVPGRGRQSLWPPDAHITLKPGKHGVRRTT